MLWHETWRTPALKLDGRTHLLPCTFGPLEAPYINLAVFGWSVKNGSG